MKQHNVIIMKKAEEWVLALDVPGSPVAAIRTVRCIQADALRYAADMSGDMKNVILLKEADELERAAHAGNG